MSRQTAGNLLKNSLPDIRERALWLSGLNRCLKRHMPLSINTVVRLVNIDSRKRAVIHVRGGEWASQLRIQYRMILNILKSCGVRQLRGVVVKNRPLEDMPEQTMQVRRVRRSLTDPSRKMIHNVAEGIADTKLRESLRRLARKSL